jgi:hypothetical protein
VVAFGVIETNFEHATKTFWTKHELRRAELPAAEGTL